MAMTSDLVSSTIVARSREPEGLRRMMMVSTVAHVAAIGALVTVSMVLGPGHRPDEVMMEISLAGAVGPVSGGLTSLSGRAVQKVEPAPELPKPVQARPPAPTKRTFESSRRACPSAPTSGMSRCRE